MWNIDRTHGDIFSKAPKLGSAISSSSIPPPDQSHGPPYEFDATDDANLNSKYVLSGYQREYVKTRYSEESSKQNNAILEKRDLLPRRIQDLINDISILHTSPYLSQEDWKVGLGQRQQTRSKFGELHRQLRKGDKEFSDIDLEEVDDAEVDHYETPYDSPEDLWEDLIDISERSQQVRDDVFFDGDASLPKEAQFGFEIGSIVQMLRPAQDEDVEGTDLIWGFILAFIGNRHTRVDHEEDKLNDLVNEIKDRHDARKKEAEKVPEWEEVASLKPEFYDETVAAVEEKGFAANKVLIREIYHHQPPLADTGEAHKQSVKNLLTELADVVPLYEVTCLAHAVSADIRTLQNKNPGGMTSVQDLLLSSWSLLDRDDDRLVDSGSVERDDNEKNQENDYTGHLKEDYSIHGPIKSVYRPQSIAKITGSGDWKQSSVTRVFNRLTDNGDNECWTTSSILNKVEGAGDRGSWRFTPYGGLLTHILDKKDGEVDLLYWYAIGPEELSLVERKLVLDSLDYLGFIDAGPSF